MKQRVRGLLAPTLACALAFGGFVGAAPAAYAAEGNLALGKTAIADSEEAPSVAAKFAVDGNTTDKSSRWGSGVDSSHGAHWLYVDLGSDQTVSSVKAFWESRKATGFKVQVLADKDAKGDDASAWGWKDVYETDERPASTESTINFDAVEARYVRLYVTGFTSDDPDGKVDTYPTVSLFEFEVYADKQEEAAPETGEKVQNLALGRPTKASADYDNADGARAVDGKKKDGKADRWRTEEAPTQWLYVDLGSSQSIAYLEAMWENAENRAADFNIYVSESTDDWGKPVHAVTGNKDAVSKIELASPVTGRYVKLEVTKVEGWQAVSCMEFEVWNKVPEAPAKQPADYLDDIVVDPVTAETKTLSYTLPKAPEGYSIAYNGTDYEQVIDLDGTIYRPIADVTVKASFKIVNDSDNTDYAFKEFDVAVPGSLTAAQGANAAPRILPELREWVGGTGSFAATAAKRAVYADDSLKVMAEDFAADFATVTGVTLDVVKGTTATSGDIFFGLSDDASRGLKDEGYLVEALGDKVVVIAEEVAGANWGAKTILQGMKTGEGSFPVGTARDYPLYRVRGLILDVGRKTFTLDWLKQMTEQMAWFKLNDFQIHLNDNLIPLEHYTNNGEDAMQAYSGFRLESDIKKGGANQADLTSTDVWYSKADFKEYIERSAALGVNIIPEIDTPAHSLALTKVRPDLRYGTDGRQNDHLDLRGEKFGQSLEFVQSIFDEYLTGGEDAVFAGTDVIHIGADEYNVGSKEESGPLYRKFVNEMFDYARENGKTPRVWGSLSQYTQGDAIHVDGEDGTRAQINLWNWGYANMDKMYEMGFDLIDCNDGHFYIVPNAGYYYDYLNDNVVYTDPLNSIDKVTIPAGDPQVIGGAFAVWNDMTDYLENGITEYDVYDRITAAAGLFGANSWGRGSLNTADAKALSQELGDEPSTNFGYEVSVSDSGQIAQWNMDDMSDASGMGRDLAEGKNAGLEQVDGRSALKLDGDESYASVADDALSTAGLGNDLRVKVKRTSASTDPQVLFESAYGQIMAVQEGTGKVGFTRENHRFSFAYELPVDEWVELEFKNTMTETQLYVNGELVDTLGDGDKAAEGKALKATTMLPLARIGSKTQAFRGYVDDVRVSTDAEFASIMELDYAVLTAESVLAVQDVPGLRDLLDAAYDLFRDADPSAEAVSELAAQIRGKLAGEDGKPGYEVADYCRIDAYAQLQGDEATAALAELFTEESVARVQAAWAQVREDLPASMQSTVDGYEAAIVRALDALELRKGGDLNFVDPALLAATASDFQADGSDPKNVLDGNPNTMWHSKWDITSGEHWLNLEAKESMSVEGIVYTPRQTGTNGNIQTYRIEVSRDGKTFEKIAEGDLKVSGTEPITIAFDRQDGVKAVKLVWVKGANGNAAAAELRLLDAAAAPNYEALQQLVDVTEGVKQDGSCDHDRFSDETWSAFQSQVNKAEDCLAKQDGDVNSVYALRGELAASMMALRLEGAPVDPDPEPEGKTFTVTIDDRVPGHEDIVLKVKEGEKVPAQADPELSGWKFEGWFTDGHEGGWTAKWSFDDPVTSDLVLTAKWSRAEVPGGGTDEPTQKPEDPSAKPGKPGTDGSLVQTGDDSLAIVGGVAAAAVVALGAGVALRRRSAK